MPNKRNYLITCIVAAGVGYGFEHLQVAHGLLLGALLATVLLRFGWKEPLVTPVWVLPLIQVVLGISTGLLFRTGFETFSRVLLGSVVVMGLGLLVYMALAFVWLRRVAQWSRTDALLAVYPGALAAILDIFDVAQASSKVVLIHVLRLFVLTVLVSVLIPSAPMAAVAVPMWGLASVDVMHLLGLLWATVTLGWLLRRAHVPAPYLLTALVLTVLTVQCGFLRQFQVPRLVSEGTTVLLGVLVGSILNGLRWRDLARHAREAITVLAIAIMVTALFAGGSAVALNLDFLSVFVAYVPGAIETVATVTLAAGMNVAFILSHHLLRLLILHALPAFIRPK